MADEPKKDEGDALVIVERWGRPALPFLVIGAALMLGVLRGPGAGVLGFAGGVLVLAISMLWGSLRMLVGEAPLTLDAAVAIGAAMQADDRKRAILRALKDLEIEHGLGKITDEDFADLSAQYRAEAKRILREIDEQMGPARKKAEELLAAHIAGKDAAPVEAKKKGKKSKKAPLDEPAPMSARDANTMAESPAAKKSSNPPPADETTAKTDEASASDDEIAEEKAAKSICKGCDAGNDPDAVFCKKCGARLDAVDATQS